jgi:hypothetical protein
MESNKLFQAGGLIVILLGIMMMILGLHSAPKILYPQVKTGIGFLVIGFIFFVLKKK